MIRTFPPVMRLTTWYVLIIMIISVGFSSAIYRLTSDQVRRGFPRRDPFTQNFGAPFNYFGSPDDLAQYFETQYESVMTHLRTTLLLLNVAVLAASAVASYFLAKRTLRPIETALSDQRRFTADASHELRTPLAAMKTEIEVALLQTDLAEHEHVLRSSLEEINKLEKMSTSLLHMARHEEELEHQVLMPVELGEVVDQACQRVEPMARQKQITFVRTGVGGSVIGDQASLIELLVILLDNAIKYSPTKSEIELVGTWSRTQAALRVTDHGVGIMPDDVPHIFRRFYRADPSRSKQRVDGHGLGLAIAKQIVERHQGQISVASVAGEGTTFTVTLPRTKK